MEEWKEYKIGNITSVNSEQYSKSDTWEYVNYLDTGNITNNVVEQIQKLFFAKDEIPSRAKRKVQKDDIIYSTVRPNQRHFGYIDKPLSNMLVSTGFAVLTTNREIADPKYIYYWLTQNNIVDFLHTLGEQAACAYPSIKPKDIEDLVIRVPNLCIQKQVSSMLSILDEKIALNRRINDNLLVMAA